MTVSPTRPMWMGSGIPAEGDKESLTVGPDGLILLQDHYPTAALGVRLMLRYPFAIPFGHLLDAFGYSEVTRRLHQGRRGPARHADGCERREPLRSRPAGRGTGGVEARRDPGGAWDSVRAGVRGSHRGGRAAAFCRHDEHVPLRARQHDDVRRHLGQGRRGFPAWQPVAAWGTEPRHTRLRDGPFRTDRQLRRCFRSAQRDRPRHGHPFCGGEPDHRRGPGSGE